MEHVKVLKTVQFTLRVIQAETTGHTVFLPAALLRQTQVLPCCARDVDGWNNTMIHKEEVLENVLHRDQQQPDVILN